MKTTPDEPCSHDERDHGICLYCGKDCDPNSPNYIPEEAPCPKCKGSTWINLPDGESYECDCKFAI